MTELNRYRQLDCPAHIRDQIVRLMRDEWPHSSRNDEVEWPSESLELNPISIVLTTDGVVICHAAVLRKTIAHVGKQYLAFGLSAMVTAQPYRRRGFGRLVLERATRYMAEEGADFGIFTCDEQLGRFYNWNGWEISKTSPLIGGTKAKPFPSEQLGKITLLQLFSCRAKADREAILSTPVYIELGEGKLW